MQTKQGVYLVLVCLPESCQIYGTWGIFSNTAIRYMVLAHGSFLLITGLTQLTSGSFPWSSCAFQTFDQRWLSHCWAFLKHPPVLSYRPPVWRDVSGSLEPQKGLQWHWVCCGVHSFIARVMKSVCVGTWQEPVLRALRACSHMMLKTLQTFRRNVDPFIPWNIGSASLKQIQLLSSTEKHPKPPPAVSKPRL